MAKRPAGEVRKENKSYQEQVEKYKAAKKLIYSQSIGPIVGALNAGAALK